MRFSWDTPCLKAGGVPAAWEAFAPHALPWERRTCELAGCRAGRARARVAARPALPDVLTGMPRNGRPDEVRQVALLALTTIGCPSMVASLTWIEDVIGSAKTGARDAAAAAPEEP